MTRAELEERFREFNTPFRGKLTVAFTAALQLRGFPKETTVIMAPPRSWVPNSPDAAIAAHCAICKAEVWRPTSSLQLPRAGACACFECLLTAKRDATQLRKEGCA
ncbi:MAG: hypothetical protein QM817_10445 [Archangium sp.]